LYITVELNVCEISHVLRSSKASWMDILNVPVLLLAVQRAVVQLVPAVKLAIN
jgi:hypothetical protein